MKVRVMVLGTFVLCAADAQAGNFMCYRAREISTPEMPRFGVRRDVVLSDEFGSGLFSLRQPFEVCVPAEVNGVGPANSNDAALKGYRLRSQGANSHTSLAGLMVRNDLEERLLHLDTVRPKNLFIPASHDESAIPSEPSPGIVDHHKCYDVKLGYYSRGYRGMTGVNVEDAFQSTVHNVLRPVRLCNPVNKNGEGIVNSGEHLVCYKTMRVSGSDALPVSWYVTDQFVSSRLRIARTSVLCVVSEIRYPGTCGDGVINQFWEQCEEGAPDSTCAPDHCHDCVCEFE